jgi:hypothetical protein
MGGTVDLHRTTTGIKKGAIRRPRLEDSTIGGEWRNASAVPKEEYGEAADATILAYCIAQFKLDCCMAAWTTFEHGLSGARM